MQRTRGRRGRDVMTEFGQCVHFMPLRGNVGDKQRAKMAMNMTPAQANENTEEGNEGEGIKTARSVVGRFCNPYAIRGCLEAIWFSYGHSVTPELPTHALYQQVWS